MKTDRPIALLICACLAFAAGAALAQDAAEKAPRAVVDESIEDVGVVPKGQKVDHTFEIRNDGNATLEITQVKPACGCTVAEYDRTIAPGATGKIRASVNTTEFRGPIQKSVKVFTNDEENPEIILIVKANVKPQIEVEPGYARFIMVRGESAATSEQTLSAPDFSDFEVLSADSPFDHVDVSFDNTSSGDGGNQWKVTIELADDAPIGPMADFVRVKTNHPEQTLVKIPISGFVRPLLAVTPQIADLGRRELKEPYEARLEVKNLGSNAIGLSGAETDVLGVAAEIEAVEEGKLYNVVLTLNPGMEKGRFKGSVRITTTSKEQPVVVVSLTGTVL